MCLAPYRRSVCVLLFIGLVLVACVLSFHPAGAQGGVALVAHWKFDEVSGSSALDSTGNGSTATLNGAARVAGRVGTGAIDFNGSNQVDVTSSSTLSDVSDNFTISFWANPRSAHEIDSEGYVWGGLSGQRYALEPLFQPTAVGAGAGVSVGTNGVSVYEHSVNYIPANLVWQGSVSDWTHIAVVYANKQPKLYINGSLVRTGITSSAAFVRAKMYWFGKGSYGNFDGKLDDIRIYDGAMSATEVAALVDNQPHGSAPAAIPGTIEAESFDDGLDGLVYQDAETSNKFIYDVYGTPTGPAIYRDHSVDVGPDASLSNGHFVGYTAAGETLEYTVNVATSDAYKLLLKYSSAVYGGTFHIEVDGVNVTGALTFTSTGSWANYVVLSKSNVNIPAGQHVLRLVIDTGGSSGYSAAIDYLRFEREQTPYGGTAASVPGLIQVENFDNGSEGLAYHDTTATNDGGYYRSEAVDICSCGSPYGLSVGWTAPAEWLEYSINVASTGTYKFDVLTATISAGTSLRIEIDGVDVTGQLQLPNTGAWGAYATTSKTGINLTAGQHILKLVIDGPGFLIDSINIIDQGLPAAPGNFTAAAASTGQINLTWADNSQNETGFRIERKTGSGGTYAEITTVGPNVTSYNNTGLSSNTQYYYRVRSTNSNGNSSYSGEANATTLNVAPSVSLTAPANGSTYTAPANISLTASASDSDGTISKVEFFQGTTKVGEDTNGADGYSYSWASVGAGSYSLTATATDNSGATTTSSTINVTVSLPTVTVSATDATASEPGSNTATFTISRTGTTGTALVVNFSLSGTANAASDYTSIGGSVTIPTGASSQTIVVTPIDDAAVETMENVTLTIASNAAYTIGSPAGATVDISDNDTYPPTTAITSPTSGTVITAPGAITVNADAADQDGTVTHVEFFQNGVSLGVDTAAPYTVTWNSIAAGNYNLTVRATDNANATGTSTAVPIVVNAAPTVGITSPANNAAFSESTLNISASATDADAGVMKVEFFKGADKIGEDTSAPYTFQWTNAPEGTHSLTAVATDTYGATTTSSVVQISVVNFNVAKLDPANRVGSEDPLSRNFAWGLSLLSLPGRAGFDLGLSLSYNSLVWTKSGSYIAFDNDRGFPAPGFRLGFPVIQPQFYNSETTKNAFLLISPDGSRTELRQVRATALYESADSSYLLLDSSTMVVRTSDGTQLKYVWQGSDYQCTEIKDRNGNFITINYNAAGHISNVIDTLARTINFNYDTAGYLTSITQSWAGQTHDWALFEYADKTIQTNFTGLTVLGSQNGATIKLLSQVKLADNSHFDFSYTTWGQVWKVSNYAADNQLLNYRSYNLPLDNTTVQTDCPRFTQRKDWAENWNRSGPAGASGLPTGPEQEATTTYAVPSSTSWTLPNGTQQSGTATQITAPDGTYHKIYFPGTAGAGGGWHRGLSSMVETYDQNNVRQRQSVSTWTQDNTNVSYVLNPRVVETNIYDPAGNRARTTIAYQSVSLQDGTSCNLPQDVREYHADATTVLRRTHTDYQLSAPYTSRRIIGLPSGTTLYEVDPNTQAETTMSKLEYQYDETGSIQGNDAPVQHDNTNYSSSFLTGRGNLSSVKRYNVLDTSQFTTNRVRYNAAGAPVANVDALNHEVTVSYGDSFSDGNNSRNTLAYPTLVNDADGYSSFVQYNYDFGGVTRKQTPQPNVTTNTPGPIQSITYDAIGRVERSTNLFNNAYTRYVYGPNYVETFATVNTVADEAHSIAVFDGAGRTIATAANHPGSVGGVSGKLTLFDAMGRPVQQSNPTETSVGITGAPIQPYGWAAAGDDAASGWLYTQQTYDWKGRPRVTTNTDGTTKEASYAGCGCAGGEVVTLTDEGTLDAGVLKRRQQKIYSDVLGRTVKTEVLNWQGGSVYSTTVSAYNVLDQVTLARQYAGAEGSATFQDTVITHDGYGRLKTKHVPEQNAGVNTTWDYNADDTIQKITDARGSVSNFSYNARHLLTGKSYDPSSGVTDTPSVSYAYDAAGNRITMSDGLGSVSYAYDELSRLVSETRTFNDPANSAINGMNQTLSYGYNLGNQVSHIIDPTGVRIDYSHNQAGQLSEVKGFQTLYAGVSTYLSNIQYRAWGALKGWDYGNTRLLALQYNSRLQMTRYEVPGLIGSEYEYITRGSSVNDNDGRVKFIRNLITTNSKFDRAYEYDHLGRLSKAVTGPAARGEADVDDRPFFQEYGYDQWNNLSSRTGKHWSQINEFTATINPQTNRNQSWLYNANGNAISQSGVTNQYDAAAQIIRNIDTQPRGQFPAGLTLEPGYDGDGQRIKQVENSTKKYFLRASALGGKVIIEVGDSGQFLRGYVYAGEAMVAKQENGTVEWFHRNPVTGNSQRTGVSGGTSAVSTMLDPLGVETGTFDWSQFSRPASDPILTSPRYTDPYRLDLGCSLDGVVASCDLVSRLMNAEVLAYEYWERQVSKPSLQKPQWTWQRNTYDIKSLGLGLFESSFPAPSAEREEQRENGFVYLPPQNSGGNQLSSCLRDKLRQFFPQQIAQGNTYSPVDDARFKNWIPGTFKNTVDPNAITLGLYDIHYDPDRVNLNGGSFESLKTIVEEVAHTVQFLQVWAGLKQNPYLMMKHGIDSTSYSSAQTQWENHYGYYAAKGKVQNGESYKNDVERWAKNRTFDILSRVRTESKTWSLCGFSLNGSLERPDY